MKRWIVFGLKVPCCSGWTVTTVPPVTLIWYQRTLAMLGTAPLPTVCASQSDSWPARLRYWFCIISR